MVWIFRYFIWGNYRRLVFFCVFFVWFYFFRFLGRCKRIFEDGWLIKRLFFRRVFVFKWGIFKFLRRKKKKEFGGLEWIDMGTGVIVLYRYLFIVFIYKVNFVRIWFFFFFRRVWFYLVKVGFYWGYGWNGSFKYFVGIYLIF